MSGAVADLEQPLARGAAAPSEPVAAVVTGELDALLLEPVDSARRLGREHVDERVIGRLMRALPDVLGVLPGRVVAAERRLDATLGLCGVARLQRLLGHEGDLPARTLGGQDGRKARGPASDDEHVE